MYVFVEAEGRLGMGVGGGGAPHVKPLSLGETLVIRFGRFAVQAIPGFSRFRWFVVQPVSAKLRFIRFGSASSGSIRKLPDLSS